MNPHVRTAADVVVRVAAFLAGSFAYSRAYDAVVPQTGDADIGKGIVEFGLMILVAALWGAWDGYHRSVGRLCVTWIAAGLLTGVVMAALVTVTEPGATLSLVLDDVAVLGPFLAGLITVPALGLGGFVAILRSAGTASGPATPQV